VALRVAAAPDGVLSIWLLVKGFRPSPVLSGEVVPSDSERAPGR
jgi:hypothetical protein